MSNQHATGEDAANQGFMQPGCLRPATRVARAHAPVCVEVVSGRAPAIGPSPRRVLEKPTLSETCET